MLHLRPRHACPLTALLLLAGMFPSTARAQERGLEAVERVIQITEPAEWRGVESRGIAVVERRSLRVSGTATYAPGVDGVSINGDRAALLRQADGSVRFTGYVAVDSRTTEVEIAAFGTDGRTFVRTFPLDPRPAEQAYASEWDAFSDSTFPGKRWAVIIGVSDYADSRIRPLRYADRDARAFYDFLVSDAAGLGGFPRENVVLLLNRDATHQNLRTALFNFLKEATEDDQIVVYFAGHGAPDPERLNQLYLLTYDTRVDNIAGSAFPMDQVAQATRELLARDIIVIADACHSAGVGGQVALRDINVNQINQTFLQELNASTGGLTIFTASQATQASHEGEQWGGGHGIFTWYMLEGLRGQADEDEDRIVTMVEMMEFTRERVRRETRNAQIPTISQTAFDQALPLAVVLDDAVYAAAEEAADQEIALPSMFATPDAPLTINMYSPRAAFFRGLALPGGGMFYVDRPATGLVYAAITLGVGITGMYVADHFGGKFDHRLAACDSFDGSSWSFDQACFDDLRDEHPVEYAIDEHDWLVYAIGGAAGGIVWLVGAVHARRVAQAANAESDRLRRAATDPPVRLTIERPGLTVSPTHGAQVEVLRLRF
ncbi:MAG TPA: caspase family protein [Longimicrobiales bacterium]|nr:caspase family protein [Longimicrobiales bacterium]